jgi:hypothetical protein
MGHFLIVISNLTIQQLTNNGYGPSTMDYGLKTIKKKGGNPKERKQSRFGFHEPYGSGKISINQV